MPWNEPGDKNKQDPWGDKRNQSPPDLEKILSEFLRKMRTLLFRVKNTAPIPPHAHFPVKEYRFGLALLFGLITIMWVAAGIFIVNPAEEAVILRFGQFSDVVQPGLHWYARFIETKYTVDVQKINSFSIQSDFLTKSSDQSDLPSSSIQITDNKKNSGLSDQSKNLVNVELNVQYRISGPNAYLFAVVNPDETIKEIASSALSDVIGTMKLDDVLTTGREMVSSSVFNRVKEVLARYRTGLEVMAVTLRKVQAPDQVRAAFNDVNRADQDRSTYIQQAQAYASKVLPLAQGDAARILADANGYQQQVVLDAQAQVVRYQALLKAYIAAPVVTRERLYLDTMQTILERTTKIVVDANSNNMLYLPLDRQVAAPLAVNSPNTLPALPSLNLEGKNGAN